MAISKKGLRKIIVDNREFYWRFDEKIFVVSEEYKNPILTIDFGWYDAWLYANDLENKPPEFEPKKVTPKFVSESISYAINHGWKDGKALVVFRHGNCEMK